MKLTDNDLRVPFEIGCYIKSLVPYVDFNNNGLPWAEHEDFFREGPNPFSAQMKEGLIIKVVNLTQLPHVIVTRYGEWRIFGSSMGNFEKVFKEIRTTLKLCKINEMSDLHVCSWAVREWKGEKIPKPILIKPGHAECLSLSESKLPHKKFIKTALMANREFSHIHSKL